MKKYFLAATLVPFFLAWVNTATAETSSLPARQMIFPNGSQASFAGPADWFTGKVRIDPLFSATQENPVSGAYVTFEPGARSAWHTHPAGQTLVVISGAGLTQEWGRPIQEIRPGDVIRCPAGIKHWHGASPRSSMMHMAITGTINGKNVKWLEKVSDTEYHAIPESNNQEEKR